MRCLREQTSAEAHRSAGHVDHQVRHGRRSQISRLVRASYHVSRDNQWADIPYLGHFPLVLDPIISNVRLKKVLIEGRSALNLLFTRALTELGLTKDDLVPIDSPF